MTILDGDQLIDLDATNTAWVSELVRLEAVLRQRLEAPGKRPPPPGPPSARLPALERLGQVFSLDPLEIDLVLLALVPELDARYQQLLADIQGSALRRRPTVGVALELFTCDAVERMAARCRFATDSSLIRWGIMTLEPDPVPGCDALATRALRLDPGVVEDLVGTAKLDPNFLSVARYLTVAAVDCELPPDMLAIIRDVEKNQDGRMDGLRLRLTGDEGTGRMRAAGRLAAVIGCPALRVDIARLLEKGPLASELWRSCLREAMFRGAMLCLVGLTTANEVYGLKRIAAWQTSWSPELTHHFDHGKRSRSAERVPRSPAH
jgi:hypothetical protein